MTADSRSRIETEAEAELVVTLDEVGGSTIELEPAVSAGVLPAVSFVDLRGEYESLRFEIDAAISGVIERGDFILGEAVSRFEESFAAYCGTGFAVGVDSGYSALELMLRAYRVGPGDEVITVANTFVATVGAIEAAGARPVLVDADPVSYNIDAGLVEAAVTAATKAILVVHLYGQPADMDPIREIAQRHGLLVFEDAAQAHGARYHNERAGSLAAAGAFSFYPAKNLGAFGDGGMVTTSDPVAFERLTLLRNLGSKEKYRHEIRGFNRRLDTLQAAVLDVKLGALEAANTARRRAAALYRELLPPPIVAPVETPGVEHVYHLYVVRLPRRDAALEYLKEHGIASGLHYPTPIHLQPAYRDLGYNQGDFPIAEHLATEILSLPMHPGLTAAEIVHVADTLTAFTETLT